MGRSYDLTLIYKTGDDKLKPLISSKTLDIPMIHLDADDNRTVICDSEHIEKSRKIAARWVPAIYTESRHISRVVVISFFAAPKWFCFDRYEIKLWQNNSILKTVVVTNNDLYQNGSNWMANVTFANITPKINHTVTIKPIEYRENDETTCLCRISSSCDCVFARSTPFSLEDVGKNIYGKVLEEKFLAKHRSKISSEKETMETKEMKPLIFVFLIFSIIAAILILAFLFICLCRTLKRTSKWQKTLLLKTTGSGESFTPLIKNPPVQKIFILNPNPEKNDFVTELSQFLRSKGLTVFYFIFDAKQLEENAFYYVHKAITDSDKIILFHGNKTQKFIEDGKLIRDRISSNYYENAFIIALSLLKLNDNKIVTFLIFLI
uniref:SEFIR domain-containing protein n=1 Tax=Panagrolaimus superbus TaxID=310955 RepID=A0A914Z3F8_9BILA